MTMIKVAVFDDVLAARREVFHIPGLDIGVFSHADDVCAICHGDGAPEVVCMDYAMGASHASGEDAIRAVRSMGYPGHILAMSSDPAANAAMIKAGADESLPQKAMLRSWLVALGNGQIKRRGHGQSGVAALGLLTLVGALAAIVCGLLCVGPWGHQPREASGLVRLAARVLPDGAQPSMIDGAPVVAEAVAVWAKHDKGFAVVAGQEAIAPVEFHVAARGQRFTVASDATTRWALADGPSRRVRTPGDVRVGEGLPGFRTNRYVARSQRVVVGQMVYVEGPTLGAPPREPVVVAGIIADGAHHAALGADDDSLPLVQLGGFVLIGVGVALLARA